MSRRTLQYVLGAVVGAVGLAMIPAAIVAGIYQEWGEMGQIFLAALLTFGIGFVAWRFGDQAELTAKEGFAIVGLAWISVVLVGTLPYILTGTLQGFTNALFESTAGFTTTGSSVIARPEDIGHGVVFWRATSQWLGGMGIIVLSVAILPLLGVGGVELARAESPGPRPDRLTPRFKETAKRLWLIYVGFTVAETLLLWVGDMTLFEAVAHSLTTLSTGGFSTTSASLGGFSAYAQWVVIVFMLLAGASFALHYRGLRNPVEYTRDAELKIYGAIIAAATLVTIIGIWGGGVGRTVRDSVFQVVSLVTTTGYATTDFNLWPGALTIMVVGLMFVGGMAGSTAGSVKTYRIGVLTRASLADIRRVIHPRGVFPVRLGGQRVPEPIVQSVQAFFLFYMFTFMTGTFVLGVFSSAIGPDLDFVSAASAVATAIGNVGPGLGALGPTETFNEVTALGKWLLSGLMIAGRLEIFPIVLLFTPELWRK
ncbi:MAG: TrkH family potassium uptake protein [Acidimicrobiia bacterium]|nr:TrkH family potassium uptake protein [Acidimicrobiia bacterium]MBT8218107.1 TrkH family potassium uptake protein [Acidimicrobiia bacterium]NNF11547.1 TrkH family potassium uptake protein [Acidimicrobiia bacterium]NNL71140.1 TrkH family potassium uptake protein [Acidimicrobiia bacterium]